MIIGGIIMSAKNILVFSISMMILVSSLGMVSAGLFDFGSGESELADYDFDDFSMEVPADLEFNKTDSLNGGDVLEKAVADNGGTISFEELYASPEYVHSLWEDENSTISILLIDFKEDGYDDGEDAVRENFVNATLIDENNDVKTFNISDAYDNTFAVSKENGKDSVVIVTGQDRDMITEMISSLEFK